MNYEKILKDALNSKATPFEVSSWIEEQFAGLAKSEDEEIRKALINVFATHKDYEMFFGVSVEDIRAWLGKQGEQKTDKDMKEGLRTEYEKGRADVIADTLSWLANVWPQYCSNPNIIDAYKEGVVKD